MIKTVIILGFPAVGKSRLKEMFKNSDIKVVDSDSSMFDKSDFPANYMRHIESLIGKVNIIMVSTHETVREAFKSADFIYDVPMYICYPSLELKDEWLDRCRNRCNNEKFIKLIDDNYEQWIKDIMGETQFEHLMIDKPDEFLSDKIKEIGF